LKIPKEKKEKKKYHSQPVTTTSRLPAWGHPTPLHTCLAHPAFGNAAASTARPPCLPMAPAVGGAEAQRHIRRHRRPCNQ